MDESVTLAISDVLPSEDALDATSFDPIEYINVKFTSERALNQLEPFVDDMTLQIAALDDDISRAVHAQAEAGARASQDICDARVAMAELHQKIRMIKEKADESEEIVREICKDVRSLDYAKRNLQTTITVRGLLPVGGERLVEASLRGIS